jgi:acetyl-CoA carboxylase biotin carboxyl carrier protein
MNGNKTKRGGGMFGLKPAGPLTVDPAVIKQLAALLDETGLGEIEIEQEGSRVRVSRGMSASAVHGGPFHMATPMAAAVTPPSHDPGARPSGPHPGTLTSPMVGTVYVGPSPGAAPFVKLGDEVKEGQTLLIVEAMKTMNPIVAPSSGKILEIFVRDAQPVEYGEPLLVIG